MVIPSTSTMWYSSGTPNDGLKFQRKMKRRGPPERPRADALAEGGERLARTVARSKRVRGSRTAQAEAANESAGKRATRRNVRL